MATQDCRCREPLQNISEEVGFPQLPNKFLVKALHIASTAYVPKWNHLVKAALNKEMRKVSRISRGN